MKLKVTFIKTIILIMMVSIFNSGLFVACDEAVATNSSHATAKTQSEQDVVKYNISDMYLSIDDSASASFSTFNDPETDEKIYKIQVTNFGTAPYQLRAYFDISGKLKSEAFYQVKLSLKSSKKLGPYCILLDRKINGASKEFKYIDFSKPELNSEWRELIYNIKIEEKNYTDVGLDPDSDTARLVLKFGAVLEGQQDPATEIYIKEVSIVEYIPESNSNTKINVSGIGLKVLKESDMEIKPLVDIKQREISPNSRMKIDNENPLFIFSPVPEGTMNINDILALWDILPADIKQYSAILLKYNPKIQRDMVIPELEKCLQITDEKNIPIFWTAERHDTAKSTRIWTYEELDGVLKRHKSLIGFRHCELSCQNDWTEEAIKRMKISIDACSANNAIMLWQDMEYHYNTNVRARFFEDKELYQKIVDYKHNIVLMDKHNGAGRHFSTQSSVFGAWLSGVTDNWGANIESWLWWEEGLGQLYEDGGTSRSTAENYIWQYPEIMFMIDAAADMVGGASVYGFEEMNMIYDYIPSKGLTFLPSFTKVIYPLYQKILKNKIIPSKEEIIEKVKVIYQIDNFDAPEIQGNESLLFCDLYGPSTEQLSRYFNYSRKISKKWLPTSGRYFIVPLVPKYVNASEVFAGKSIINSENYAALFPNTQAKLDYFNDRYEPDYSGSAWAVNQKNNWYIFNPNENSNIMTNVKFKPKLFNNIITDIELREHTFILLSETYDSLKFELNNYRSDVRSFLNKNETKNIFLNEYAAGLKDTNPEDFRETVIMLQGLKKEPLIEIKGENNASAGIKYNKKAGNLIIRISHNGRVNITINQIEQK